MATSVPRRSMLIAAFSTIVEWYDFTLYLYMAPILAKVFFEGSEDSTLATLGVFAVSYILRPVGGAVLGTIGDRIGRRRVLLISMTIMAVAMFLTGLIPAGAALLMFLLRCAMGFSVGGEYSGVLVMLVESADRHRRGFVASLASGASEVGALLASGVATLVVLLVPGDQLYVWGWRIPFFVGAALALLTLLMRTTVSETPAFERALASGALPANPLKDVLVNQRLALWRTFAVSALGSVTYYVAVTYVPTYLTTVAGIPEARALTLSTVAAVAVIVVTPFIGLWSDRVGRRPMLIGLTVAFIVLPLPMFGLMAGGGTAQVLIGALVLAAGAGAVSAAAAACIPEQFATAGRMSGMALGYTMATAAFGGLSPFVADLLIKVTGWDLSPGLLVVVVAIGLLPVLVRLPETANRDLTDLAVRQPA
ncbi:MFS transporter [Nonomuraea soli]|uniref:MHS family proline/betaine transporter-like MFS transporter n=1 Tax=Nonomuraea soli TaxID=1032476 RepID=A0A7W0HMF2_9ACTN|nr:MFS transporter [Nonomuraea soli]MBA2888683.1 MHS family proline/betaine transporter-like MFS transporter [Nonomuraea soli]